MMRKLMLSSLFFGSVSCTACTAEACDSLESWPEAEPIEAEGLELLQRRSQKLEFEAESESQDPPSCMGLWVAQGDSSLLQVSNKVRKDIPLHSSNEMTQEALRLPFGSDSKLKESAFNAIYRSGAWAHSSDSNGAILDETTATRAILSAVLGHIAQDKLYAKQKAEIRMLDAACGDMQWMPRTWKESEVIRMNTLLDYHGVDVASEVLARDEALLQSGDLYSHHDVSPGDVNARFSQMDLAAEPLGEYDLIFMKDTLEYLHNEDITKIIANIKQSGSKYLLITTDPTARNQELDPAFFNAGRPVNVHASPYNLDGLMCMDFQASDTSPARLALFDLQAKTPVLIETDAQDAAITETQDASEALPQDAAAETQ